MFRRMNGAALLRAVVRQSIYDLTVRRSFGPEALTEQQTCGVFKSEAEESANLRVNPAAMTLPPIQWPNTLERRLKAAFWVAHWRSVAAMESEVPYCAPFHPCKDNHVHRGGSVRLVDHVDDADRLRPSGHERLEPASYCGIAGAR